MAKAFRMSQIECVAFANAAQGHKKGIQMAAAAANPLSTSTTLTHTLAHTHAPLKSGTQNNKLINIFNHISIKYCVSSPSCLSQWHPSPSPSPFGHPLQQDNGEPKPKPKWQTQLVCCSGILHNISFASISEPKDLTPHTSSPRRMPRRAGHSMGQLVPRAGMCKCLSHEFILVDFDLKVFRLHNLNIFIAFQQCRRTV